MNEPDLLALVLTLQPVDAPAADVPPVYWWGRAAHNLLLSTVQTEDAEFSARLHDETGVRPFTASTLLGRFTRGVPDPAQTYTLRYTALSAELCAFLRRAIQPGGAFTPGAVLTPGAVVELDRRKFLVQAAALTPAEHPAADSSSYTTLAASALASNRAPDRRVGLQFLSPATFRSNGADMPLPLPGLVFSSLLERWNAFAPLAFPPETARYALECLVISRFELRSRPVRVKESATRQGATGFAVYTTRNYDRYWMSILHTLADFARFSGVGGAVSSGMGQACAWLPPASADGE